jgi:hypothetical protein
MTMRWLLLHPPLLGPAVMRPLAEVLRGRGATVAVPDLRSTLTPAGGWPERYTAAAAGSVGSAADVVVGYSGAGVVIPSVAVAVGAHRAVWIDAVVPAVSGSTVPSAEIRALVQPLVGDDGSIAEWTTWWGPDALPGLIPDARLRAAVAEEGHRLPGDFYEQAVPVPQSWPEDGARYVQLSEAYDADAAQARARGWQVTGSSRGAHLDVATDPVRIAALLDAPSS